MRPLHLGNQNNFFGTAFLTDVKTNFPSKSRKSALTIFLGEIEVGVDAFWKKLFFERAAVAFQKIEWGGQTVAFPSRKNATLPQNSINSRPFPKYSHLFDAGMRVLAERERNADIYFPIPSQFYFSERNASFSFRMLGKGGLWVGGCGVSNHSQKF